MVEIYSNTCIIAAPPTNICLQLLRCRISSVTWWFCSVLAEAIQGSGHIWVLVGMRVCRLTSLLLADLALPHGDQQRWEGAGTRQKPASFELILEATYLAFSMLMFTHSNLSTMWEQTRQGCGSREVETSGGQVFVCFMWFWGLSPGLSPWAASPALLI